MNTSRAIFLNRFFYPDHSATSQMLSDLAFALADIGMNVSVVTSRQLYENASADLPKREQILGVDVLRVWSTRFGRRILLGRAVDYLTFYLSSAVLLWRLARKGDVVIAKTDPPMLSAFAAPIAHWRGAKLINWLQDIFPEVAQELGVRLPAPVGACLRASRNRTLRRAGANVVLGSLMSERVKQLGAPSKTVRIISNWADGTLIRPIAHSANSLRAEWGLSDRFVVGYSGNLGRAHISSGFLKAMEETRQLPITWLFIGGGVQMQALKAEAAARQLANVQFRPYQPREQLAESLAAIDLHIVSLKPGLEGLIVPSKFYGIAAAGRPALFIGDKGGEIPRMLSQYDCGVTASEDENLAPIIAALASDSDRMARMGHNARTAFEAEFDLPHAVTAWARLLAELGLAASETLGGDKTAG